MKLITFTVPCYNSAAYMDHCIETLLTAGEDAEIILVDDGSKDDTGKIADAYAEKYPTIVRVIHQENGGHGEGVNQGIRNATGVYFKVVDSDDWLDGQALSAMLSILRGFIERDLRVDLFISNYVYEKVHEGTHNTVSYRMALPRKKIFEIFKCLIFCYLFFANLALRSKPGLPEKPTARIKSPTETITC